MHHNRTDFEIAAFKSNNIKYFERRSNQKFERQRRFEDKVLRWQAQQYTPKIQKVGGNWKGKKKKEFSDQPDPDLSIYFLQNQKKQTQLCLARKGNVPLDLKQNILL